MLNLKLLLLRLQAQVVLLCLLPLFLKNNNHRNNNNVPSSVVGVANALVKIGRRKIQCTTPIGGNENVDALMEPRGNIPGIIGFVGAQAALPTLGKCPASVQWQAPWFSGNVQNGGGLCPVEYWNLGAVLPGVLIIVGAATLYDYIKSNRLLITDTSLGTVPVTIDLTTTGDSDAVADLVSFSDIENWYMTPVGLMLKTTKPNSNYKFFPLFWDQKSVEAVLDDRISV